MFQAEILTEKENPVTVGNSSNLQPTINQQPAINITTSNFGKTNV